MATSRQPFTVILTEKPSVARDVGKFLLSQQGGGTLRPDEKQHGYWLPNGDFITFTVGHIVSFEYPDAYLEPEQQRAAPLSYLPILPAVYKTHPRFAQNKDGSIKTRKERDTPDPSKTDGSMIAGGDKPVIDPLYLTIEKMCKKADIIINAGDIGREGQLIMDELFIQMGIDPCSPHIKRVKIVDQAQSALAEAFSKMGSNADPVWSNLGAAGQCRQIADWSVGMNASRAYWDLTGNRRIALGRVKTPVLALVVERCIAIENFKPIKYFVPIVTLADGTEMRWKARADSEGKLGFDAHGRIISEQVAKDIVLRINNGLQGKINDLRKEKKEVSPPKPFKLATLQSEASKKLGVSIDDVTKAAQALYEKHKLISYVGTECQYLPESMLADARSIMESLSPMFRSLMQGANSSMKPAVFSDAKIAALGEEHHAIAPKGNLPNGTLDAVEKGVFDMITRRFAAQFYPDFVYTSFALGAEFGEDQFQATGRETVQWGWKDAEGTSQTDEEDDGSGASDQAKDADTDSDADKNAN